jgi:VIT1/CCC1 family predicted Fe2+/Mn2+ transporter
MPSESPRKRLPFEPGGKDADKKDAGKSAAPKQAAASVSGQPSKKAVSSKKTTPNQAASKQSSARQSASKQSGKTPAAIPEAVSNRMLRRMLAFSGVPTVLGVLTFFVSYYLVVNQVMDLPSYFVLLVTLGCFGLGVVGLTYGVLSASWDEDRPGTWLGLDEFRVNFGRMTSAWGAKSDQ